MDAQIPGPNDDWVDQARIAHFVCELEQLVLWAQALQIADREQLLGMVGAMWDAAAEDKPT